MSGQGLDPGSVLYSQVVDRAPGGGPWRRALELFEGVEGALGVGTCRPNAITFASAITACARLGDLPRALELRDAMSGMGLSPNPFAYNALLAACERAGRLDVALGVLRDMRAAGVPPDAYTYSSTICCCAPAGDVAAAERLLGEMRGEGVTPNSVVMNSFLGVCAAAGAADTALAAYESMRGELARVAPPDEISYHCLIEALAKAGRWGDGLRAYAAARGCGYHRDGLSTDPGAGGEAGSAGRRAHALAPRPQRSECPLILPLKLLPNPPPAAIDLHNLSVLGAAVALRVWFVLLRGWARRGRRVPGHPTVITGWGRNSENHVPRLKPQVSSMLAHDLGAPLAFSEPRHNAGVLEIDADT